MTNVIIRMIKNK